MTTTEPVVIVGAGLAGATTASALRTEGFDGEIVLVGAEPELPYERPPLSKSYLTDDSQRAEVFVHPSTWYSDAHVDVRLGVAATAIDPAQRHLVLAYGTVIHYGELVLTTGSAPRRLRVPGADLDGVHYLRTLADSDRLRSALSTASRVAVVGGGWIGLEVAAAARSTGLPVTVVEAAALPLVRVLGAEAARFFAELHRRHGVRLRCGAQLAEITGGPGPATGLLLADGTHIPADVIVVGVGIAPETGLAESAGLRVDNGIRVDQHLRTSDPHIYAAGDVANAYHPHLRRHVRVEHWANALHQPPVAAQTILGRSASYDRLPYFFTDQYDVSMEYTGHVAPDDDDRFVFRGDIDAGNLAGFWLAGDRVRAGMTLGSATSIDEIADLIRSETPVDTTLLSDPAVPLAALHRTAATPSG